MSDETILIADDDQSIRMVLTQALGRQGYAVRTTGNASTLWQWVSEGLGDLVITDVVMPDENGLDLIPRLHKLRPELRIIVMSAQSTLSTAVRATERGAFEYLAKPFDLKDLVAVVQRALTLPSGPPEPEERDASEALPADALSLIGRSPAMQEIYRVLARLTANILGVMIYGESGTGKELIARALHSYGPRRDGPFIAINMAAVPRDLIESELFGHEKGAFTGATNRSSGRFEQARGGTLFLDEIGDMPLEAQTRLLRVLQEGEFTSVGGRQPIRVDTRIIAATHRDLGTMVRNGLFREDLFFRLNVVPVRLPALRDRKEDIPELVRHFFSEGAATLGLSVKSLEPAAMAQLQAYDWPGNVRELENLARRLAVLYSEDHIGADVIEKELRNAASSPSEKTGASESLSDAVDRHLDIYFKSHGDALPASGVYDRVLHEIERPLIRHALKATNGNQIRAAELLGLNRNTLRKKIRDLDIQVIRGIK